MAGCAGDPEHQAHIAAPSALLPGLHLLRGWDPHVGPVERAAGVHGHLLGLRMVRSSYFLPVFRIRIDRVFSPIRIRTLKTRIRPLTNQWDLNSK